MPIATFLLDTENTEMLDRKISMTLKRRKKNQISVLNVIKKSRPADTDGDKQ